MQYAILQYNTSPQYRIPITRTACEAPQCPRLGHLRGEVKIKVFSL